VSICTKLDGIVYTRKPSYLCIIVKRNDLHSFFLGIGIASYHRIDLVLALVLQSMELASADVASVLGHITVDGSFADSLGNIFALCFVVRLTVTVTVSSSVRRRERAVIVGNDR
jgi:hypothetical protein